MKLYAISKNGKIKVISFEKSIENGIAILTTSTGYIDGTQRQNKERVFSGKNIGKANETTLEEQLDRVYQTRLFEAMKDGYKYLVDYKSIYPDVNVENMTESEAIRHIFKTKNVVYNTDHEGFSKVMLAEKYKNKTDKIKFPVFCQPKYNGVRCKLTLYQGEIVMRGREAAVYRIRGVIDGCKYTNIFNLLQEGYEIDGELYSHGTALQDIVSKVTNQTDLFSSNEGIKYIIYDVIFPFLPQNDRIGLLRNLSNTSYITISEGKMCYNHQEVLDYYTYCRNKGYEGCMVRLLDGVYEYGFRSNYLLKVKGTQSCEVIIEDFNLNDPFKTEDFVFVCKVSNGKQFEVKPHGTIQYRKNLYNDRENLVGKKLQLDFHEYTKDGIPFHITSVTIRDYE
jgi:DNA ligase-1